MLYFIANNLKGRAVFADCNIKAGQIIMSCPVLIVDTEDTLILRQTILDDYIFDWPSVNESIDSILWTSSAVVLGDGSLINHSEDNNTVWIINRSQNQVIFTASRIIPFNSEITINYHWDEKKYKKLGVM